ncbi:MAG: hypothetical protein JKY37_32660, partial [Nannocystaceae bacterium]|nr:hypothetical protein [Nannocystaceae bacterium]
LAGALALAFPIAGLSARTVLGNPIGELAAATAVIAGLAAMESVRRRDAVGLAMLAAVAAALAVSANGLALGLGVPATCLAVLCLAPLRYGPSDSGRQPVSSARMTRLFLVGFALVVVGVTVMLVMRQTDGYVPVLGAAKDLELIDKPHLRRFASGFEDFGYQLFPWTPLVLLGVLTSDRDRLGPVWLTCAVVGGAAWSVVYGTVPFAVVVPAALCGAAAIERISRPKTSPLWRRAALVAIVGGILVLGKDAEHAPDRIIAPMSDYPGGRGFPDDALDAALRLQRLRSLAALAILLAGLTAARRGRLGRAMSRIPDRHRAPLTASIVGLAGLTASLLYTRGTLEDLSTLLSPRTVLARYDTWVAAGALPGRLGAHRIRDEGLQLYGPAEIETLGSRRDAITWLSADEPRVVLLRKRDLAAVHMNHRHNGWPLHVLDRSHATLILVANVLPEGAEDLNPIPAVLFDEAPVMKHETMLRFENYIEVIGWQATEPIIRGRKATIEIAIRVLRPLPGGCKLYTRLLKGRSSRMAVEPQPLTMDIYPPNLWRAGDFIVHRFEFEAPPLEIQWGPHEVIVGLRRSETKNIGITVPEGKTGEFGVRVRGKKRTFATLGEVEVL